jgi:Na+/H+ antiporter NhaD/arsenite permease-like protein
MIITAVVLTFIIGYLVIVFEHPLHLDKTVPALLMGALCWAFVSLGHLNIIDSHHHLVEYNAVDNEAWEGVLLHHIGKVAEILIFLIGAMTIVELIDLHKGFAVITNRIKTTSKFKMLVLVSILAFFLSATLDNLAATIVLVSLLRRLVPDKTERIWFVSLAVIAANAGGAWSPIGDVTTTMLWIGKKVSTMGLITHLVLPSIVCIAIPLLVASRLKAFKGNITLAEQDLESGLAQEKILGSKRMLAFGLGGLVFVPIFKTITHLPPYIGMMLALGVVWLVSEYIHPHEDFDRKQKYSAHNALSRIEMSSILFFLGILVAVAALESIAVTNVNGESVGLLRSLADQLQAAVPNQNLVIILLGVLSAIIDNVPLVAASMGMYTYELDDTLWHFIAYSAGTGGSMLIIGSAAGVAAMGMERIDFIWYLKNITWLAALGFIGGALTFIALQGLF